MIRSEVDWLALQEERYAELKRSLRRDFDPWGLVGIWSRAGSAWLTHPVELGMAMTRYVRDISMLSQHTGNRVLGKPDEEPFPVNPEDQRFADPAWTDYPFWHLLKESYLLQTRWIQDMLYKSPGLTDMERRKSAFWLRQLMNTFAPSNFLLTNPTALQRAYDTRGDSVVKGLQNLAADMEARDITMTDRRPFKVGQNLAVTPGAVVYRNRLMEVIHYTPTTKTVHATPLVLITPWINKYYILDLNPQKSLVKYLVDQGFNVFITSWKNPTPDMADVTMDDYITEGAVEIIQVARNLGKSDKVHALGYCIGGTLLALYMAWANRRDPANVPVAHWTLLTTLVDFSHPGDVEVFIDEDGLAVIDSIMEKQGCLDGKEMASSFRMLRANSLIWNYVVGNYLLGDTPPAFDVLYWNTDTTRMPRAMHRYYLREFYLNNRVIIPDSLQLADESIDLRRISQPLFLVGAEEDHIAPWQQAFRIAQHINAPVTLTLSTSGHILGIVNPPSPTCKRQYWQGPVAYGERPLEWQAAQKKHPGSWWPSWVAWLAASCGERIAALPVASAQYPKLADAPGEYVLEG